MVLQASPQVGELGWGWPEAVARLVELDHKVKERLGGGAHVDHVRV